VSGAAAAAADPPGESDRSDIGFDSPEYTGDLMSIGEVLACLREDFPDITISKLRFLEEEGLVEPVRTTAGYRKYAAADVDRLGFVLAAQRDRFLPLRVIRDYLDALDRGETAEFGLDAYESRSQSGPETAYLGPDHPARDADADEFGFGDLAAAGPIRRDDMIARTGLSDVELTELEDAGLICPRPPGWYDADALIIGTIAARLAKHGIGGRHLRPWRTSADREVGLFAAVVAPLAKSASGPARAQAAETARELAALSQQLHAALVRVGLRDTLGS
jgi:DNA-binding transcriptional MerR regulator